MSLWSSRRQLNIVFVFVAIVIVIAAGAFFYYRAPASCSDGKKNQGELAADCGGPCLAVCSSETSDIIVLWARTFRIRAGVYNAVAFLRNPNRFSAARLAYRFKLYDKSNLLVREISGETFVNPEDEFPIIENAIGVGARVPVRAVFEISEISPWQRAAGISRPAISISDKEFSRAASPTITTKISNDSLFDIGNITIVAIVLDETENAAGASSTFVESLGKGETRNLIFTWPEEFSAAVSFHPPVDLYVRVNLEKL